VVTTSNIREEARCWIFRSSEMWRYVVACFRSFLWI
jgi:hypothetical protein